MRKSFTVFVSLVFLFHLSCKENTGKNENIPLTKPKAIEEISTENIDSLQYYLGKAIQKGNFKKAYQYQLKKHEVLNDSISEIQQKKLLDSLKLFAVKSNEIEHIAESHYKLGLYFKKQFVFDSSYYHFNTAKNHYLKIKDSLSVAKSLIKMGMIQSAKGDYLGCEQSVVEGISYLNENVKDIYKISAYNVLGYSSYDQRNYENAIYWYKKGIAIKPDANYIPALKTNMALAYRNLGNYKKAIEIYDDLFSEEKLLENPKSKARLYDNSGLTYFKIGEEDKALSLLKKGLSIREEINDVGGLVSSYLNLARFYKNKNRPLAKEYAEKGLQISLNPDDDLQALEILADLSNDKTEYLEQYIHIKDSIFEARKNATDQFAKIRYESKTNRETILNLQAEKARQELMLASEENRKIIFFLSSIFIIIVGLILFFVYRNQHHKKQKIAVLNTQSEISKRIHDEVANDVYQLMNAVEYNKTISTKDIIDRLEYIYMRTRAISREVNSEEITENYTENLKSLLESFQSEKINLFIQI
ncbi:tetratricopeptide repeat protein [Mesonia maritima]|uniref:tetratricopeptide repeat protein n=1 Tax=Mesonia maritima TaxID=1793873 RepID=UPI00363F7F19